MSNAKLIPIDAVAKHQSQWDTVNDLTVATHECADQLEKMAKQLAEKLSAQDDCLTRIDQSSTCPSNALAGEVIEHFRQGVEILREAFNANEDIEFFIELEGLPPPRVSRSGSRHWTR